MLTESPLLPWELIDSPRANGSYLIQRADCKSSGPAAAFQFAHSSPGRVLTSVKCSPFVLIVLECVCVCVCVCVCEPWGDTFQMGAFLILPMMAASVEGVHGVALNKKLSALRDYYTQWGAVCQNFPQMSEAFDYGLVFLYA